MQKSLRISLVIPAYNEESHLAACLQAALTQTVPFYEIIVVDNASSDATARIAAQFAGVTLLREAKRGIVFARNRGFNAATGDIIARIDADTILPPQWAAHVRDFYGDATHATTAWTCGGVFSDVPAPQAVAMGYRLVSVHINRWLTGYASLWGSSMALPRSLWQVVAAETCEATNFHEDLDLATHLHTAGYTIYADAQLWVGAQLRHAWVSNGELWEYLQWWPRTLRRHGQKSWLICWLGGALAMFPATLVLASYRKIRLSIRPRTTALADTSNL